MIAEAWGRIDGQLYAPILVTGDVYRFPVPESTTGEFPVEIWATDTAGNTSYKAGILVFEEGSIKCFRWLTDRISCVMKPVRPRTVMCYDRATCVMLPHTCPMSEA